MPTTFDVTVRSDCTAEHIFSAFATREYWTDRFDAFGTSTALDDLDAGAGWVMVTTRQDLRHDKLPRLLAKVYPRDLWVRTIERWEISGDNRIRGGIDTEVIGAPGSGRGDATIDPCDDGSRMVFRGTVEFRIPLIGSKVETLVAHEFTEHIPQMQDFTTEWIHRHD